MNERQQKYLAVLRETGSAPRARQSAGVVRKTVSLWERDPDFSEATAEAQEAANAALLERAREMAMAGDSSVMTTWMKALIPALRPQSSVAVGVQVNNGATSRHANLSGAQLRAEVERALEEDRLFDEASAPLPPIDVVDVVPKPNIEDLL